MAAKTISKKRTEVPDIVLVQDDPLFLEILEYSLGNLNFRMKSFSNGWEATTWLNSLKTNGRRPVVLLESDLPGLEAQQLLLDRGFRGSDDLQFVILSVDGSESAQVLAYQSGATDYIVKPIRIPIVLAKVQRLLDGVSR